MVSLRSISIPRPKNWQDFERQSKVLFQCVLGDPHTQMNGRSGQQQHGVDVFGRRNQSNVWVGVQCKGRDSGYEAAVSEKELRAEVAKARQFTPAISEFFLLTTAPDDAAIQRVARQITEEECAGGRKLALSVWGWQTLEAEISRYPDAVKAFHPDATPFTDRILENQQTAQAELSAISTKVDKLSNDIGARQLPLDLHEDRYDLPALNRAMHADHRLANLPALFPGAPERPLAALYVELRIAPRRHVGRHSRLLSPPQSLAERITEHERYLRATNRSIEQAIHDDSAGRFVVVGDPGSGKSSLLRQIALKVSDGKWPRWQCSFFVELSRLVRRKRSEDTWTRELLLTLAIEQWLEPQEQARGLARQWAQGLDGPGRPVFLFDGLDEIAGNNDAHAEICDLIARLPQSVDWIVSSRATGLTRSLAEERRYEISPLDELGLTALVANWFRTSSGSNTIRQGPIGQQRGDALVKEVLAHPRLLSMARNPFLLSALCFLKELAPDGHVLPSTRVDVYDELLHQVARHAQTHYGDRRILDAEAQQSLARFCLWTYDQASETPFQIFEIGHWQVFQEEEGRSVDFHTRILPARLITQISEIGEAFHFLHLSLHEFLIARAALDEPVEDMLRRRYLPTWRATLMFYGALLMRAGRFDDFRRLAAALADPPDLTHLMLIETAQLFDEADVSDTQSALGYDLIDRLWQAWLSKEHYTSRAALEALWRAPWSRMEARAEQLIAARQAEARALPPSGPGQHPTVLSGRDPYMLLAGRRDGISEHRLIRSFLDEPDDNVALCMVDAVAMALTRSGRDDIVEAARHGWIGPKRQRFLALFKTAKHPDFLPLIAELMHATGTEDEVYDKLSNILAGIDSESAISILEREALRCLRSSDRTTRTGWPVQFVAALAGKATIARADALRRIQAQARDLDDFMVEMIDLQLERVLPFDESKLLESILATENEDQLQDLLHAAEDAQVRGAVVSTTFVNAVAQRIDALAEDLESPQPLWRQLLAIDQTRIEGGAQPVLLQRAAAALNELVAMSHEPLDPANTDYQIGQVGILGLPLDDVGQPVGDPREMFHALADYLVAARHLSSRECLLKVASAPPQQWGRSSRFTAVAELADLAESATEERSQLRDQIIAELSRIFREANAAQDNELAEAAGWAIGCWDLATLMRLRTEPNTYVPLCRFSSEKGFLIYESFYVTPDGETVDLPSVRPSIFVVMPTLSAGDFVETFFGHLVTWGFTNDVVDPANCIGGIIVVPHPVSDSDLHQDLLHALMRHAHASPRWPVLVLSSDEGHVHGVVQRLSISAETLCISLTARSAADYAGLRTIVEAWKST